MISLPIPHRFKSPPPALPPRRLNFSDIRGVEIGALVQDLTCRLKRPVKSSEAVHLDPDLRPESLERKHGWRPLFGQADAAQRHLHRQNVEVGDIFLFFGWFRQVEKRNGRFAFKADAPDLHVFFGWLQIGEIWGLKEILQSPDWADMHPHVVSHYGGTNTIYVAAKNSGEYSAGVFRSFSDRLVLTAPGRTRSSWRLPKWFLRSTLPTLTYHSSPARWTDGGDCTYLQTVGRGQEFIMNTINYPEAESWARRLISQHGSV